MPPDAPLLRCYGETDGEPLLVGLPAPENGRLRLRRHLSKETLKAAGCVSAPPKAFYLAEHPGQKNAAVTEKEQPSQDDAPPKHSDSAEPPLQTGDAVLDALLDGGEVRAERRQKGLRLHCPFVCDRPFALAPAFVLCRVEGDEAILDWTKKDAADVAASDHKQEFT